MSGHSLRDTPGYVLCGGRYDLWMTRLFWVGGGRYVGCGGGGLGCC